MTDSSPQPEKLSRWQRLRKTLSGLLSQYPLWAMVILFACGIIFWGGFNTALELTNTESFCISCHEMRENVYKEYRTSVHFSNRTGVRATCPDCHVPKTWGNKVVRKVGATNELFHHFRGTVDTRKKFLVKRLTLAEYVWADMRENDSLECRNCHGLDYMKLKKQKYRARVTHRRADKEGRTCIDCHMGIAHKIASDFDKDRSLHDRFQKEKRPCSDCHKGMPLPPQW